MGTEEVLTPTAGLEAQECCAGRMGPANKHGNAWRAGTGDGRGEAQQAIFPLLLEIF